MQHWSYGLNGYCRTCGVSLEEGPWWAFWLTDGFLQSCDRMPTWRIPLLDRFKIVRDDEEYTFGGYYGDDLRNLWHSFVCMPLFDFGHKYITCKYIKLPWESGKELFYEDDKTWWDEEERDGAEMRREKPLNADIPKSVSSIDELMAEIDAADG